MGRGGGGRGKGDGAYPCCYEDVVVPPQISPDEVLGVDAQDEEDGGKGGEGPVDREDGAAAVLVGAGGELLGRGHAGHGDDVSVNANRAVSTLEKVYFWRTRVVGIGMGGGTGAGDGRGFGSQGAGRRRQSVDVQDGIRGSRRAGESAERGGWWDCRLLKSSQVPGFVWHPLRPARADLHAPRLPSSALWTGPSGEWRG